MKTPSSSRARRGRNKISASTLSKFIACLVLICAGLTAHAQVNCSATGNPCVTLTGYLSGANGSPASNYTISLKPSQLFYVAGTGVVVNTTQTCATSTDGSVVGIPNPLSVTNVAPQFSGTLPSGTYYVEYTFYNGAYETLPSPEITIQLSSAGGLEIDAPTSGIPAGAQGMKVYISATSGAETLQGTTVGTASFIQSTPLVSGAVPPATNNSVCKQVANDAGWPTGTGYVVALTDSDGNAIPGYPMQWQLLGPGTTINLSNGLPYYHGVVTFPVPILASPLNHATQSISGGLSLTGYYLLSVGRIGVGTSLPAFGIDVQGSTINTSVGYMYQGGGGIIGQCLVSDGTEFIPGSCNQNTSFYQTVRSNGTAVPQEPNLNFSSNFTVNDDAPNNQTTVDFNKTGSGTKLASATAAGVSGNCAYWTPSGDVGDTGNPCITGTTLYFTLPTCQPGTTDGVGDGNLGGCSGTYTLPQAQPDTNYRVVCTANTGANLLPGSNAWALVAFVAIGTKTTTTIQYGYAVGKGSSSKYPYSVFAECILHHN